MKIVFSRKGFDSAAGGVPSPVIDGVPVSLPIPTRMPTPTCFGDLAARITHLVTDLTKGRIAPDAPCHLDPDLDRDSMTRLPGWRGALGQVGAAQSHLANQGVGTGDVFLFWGLFRAVRRSGGHWKYIGTPEHRIYGWLQIEEILTVGEEPEMTLDRHPWLAAHPHVARGWQSNNTVYLARRYLDLPGVRADVPGFGLKRQGLRLTSSASNLPSTWSVPSWLNPRCGGVGMTYHPPQRWISNSELRSAARGQEFIADIGTRADAIDWLVRTLDDEI